MFIWIWELMIYQEVQTISADIVVIEETLINTEIPSFLGDSVEVDDSQKQW